MEVYISTGAFRFKELAKIIEFSINHGINHIELSSGVTYQPNLLKLVRATHEKGIHYLVHNYFPPPERSFVLNLASFDQQIQKLSVDLCRKAIGLSSKLGAPFYSVHSGFAFDMSPDLLGNPKTQRQIPKSAHIPYDAAYDIFKENVTNLAKYAGSKGVRLLIENNVLSPAYVNKHNSWALLMASADELVRFIADVDDPNLGVLVDVGHVNVTATTLGFSREKFVEVVAPYIGAFHLSNNDGYTDQNLPFDQTAWFCPILCNFPDVPVVIEAQHLSWRQMQRQYRVLEAVLV